MVVDEIRIAIIWVVSALTVILLPVLCLFYPLYYIIPLWIFELFIFLVITRMKDLN